MLAIATFVAIVGTVAGVVAGAVGALAGLASGALGAAANFVSGLVDGISAGAGAVGAAVAGLASGALSAFTGALGIHSPSTIMLEHGEENIAGAAATGIEEGTPQVQKASAKMGDAAKPGKGGGGKGSKGDGSGGGPNLFFDGCTFIGNDESGVRAMMMKVWAELAAGAGARQEPEPT